MTFADKVWWTRKARIQAEKRLLANGLHSELLLLWYSFFGVAISIYYLKFDNGSDLAGISWVIFSVLILVMGGFVSGRSFKERAALIKDSYIALQSIVEKAKSQTEATPRESITRLNNDYESILNLCENHKDIDYAAALCKEYASSHQPPDASSNLKPGFDRRPTWYHWVSWIRWSINRILILIFLYLLPVILLVGIKHLR